MIFKQSNILTTDRSGAGKLRVFHTYPRLWKRYADNGSYVKASIQTLERLPRRIRGRRYRPLRPGYILRSLIVTSSKLKEVFSTNSIASYANRGVTLKRRGVLKSSYILGAIARPLRSNRFSYLFNARL
jgi:ribosomal protein L14